jgi:L-asparaginase II
MAESNVAPPVLVRRTRGGEVESVHRGWAVLWEDGRVRAVGDPDTPVFTRSCTKPFQALACIVSGAADRYGLTAEELAIACASHNGSPAHCRLASGILAKAGLDARHLQCGTSEPFGEQERKLFLQKGESPSTLIHNCSGKHAAFLLTQVHLGGRPEDYLKPDSPVQTLVRELVGRALDTPPAALGDYVDGCSAPTFRPTMRAIALGFARLANPELAPPDLMEPLGRLGDAIGSFPWAHSGSGRLCRAILEASGGGVIPKNGAEALYVFGVRNKKTGFAVKVEDGSDRGYEAIVADTLLRHGFVPPGGREALKAFLDLNIYNAAGFVVGRQEIVAKL